MQKRIAKTLIKRIDYECFKDHFRKMTLKSIKKALGFSLKVEGVLRLCEMSKKHWS